MWRTQDEVWSDWQTEAKTVSRETVESEGDAQMELVEVHFEEYEKSWRLADGGMQELEVDDGVLEEASRMVGQVG